MQTFFRYKKRYQKDNETNKSFDKLYRKTLQDNLIDEIEYYSLCKNFIRYIDGTRNESFL